MKAFPKIKKAQIESIFNRFVQLFAADKGRIIHSAARVTVSDTHPIIHSNTKPIDTQIGEVLHRAKVVADRAGQNLLVLIIEDLWDDLNSNPIVGLTPDQFLLATKIDLVDGSIISYHPEGRWQWSWKLVLEDDEDYIDFDIRGKNLLKKEIVPDYVVANIQQAISAYNASRFGACLSLASISLESTLRDALLKKGYKYSNNTPRRDSYDKRKVQIWSDENGYRVSFPDHMPKSYSDFEWDESKKLEVNIKRVSLGGKSILQLSGVDGLLNFWSSDQIIGRGVVKIAGLGTALAVARNKENIIDTTIFPEDLDLPITAVRNNLIHLSGEALDKQVYKVASGGLSLEQYLNNRDRVFDSITSIGRLINDLYLKLARGDLDKK